MEEEEERRKWANKVKKEKRTGRLIKESGRGEGGRRRAKGGKREDLKMKETVS